MNTANKLANLPEESPQRGIVEANICSNKMGNTAYLKTYSGFRLMVTLTHTLLAEGIYYR